MTFHIGQRVRTTQQVDKYPDFIVPVGAEGVVVAVPDSDNALISVKMDEPVDGCEPWDNEVWFDDEDMMYPAEEFLEVIHPAPVPLEFDTWEERRGER